MALDVWLADQHGVMAQGAMVQLSEATFRALRTAARAAHARVLAGALRSYYGADGDFTLALDAAQQAAAEVSRLLAADALLDGEAAEAKEFAALCRRAAAAGLQVQGYAD